MKFSKLDELCINTLRTLSIDAVQKANSGHPGLPLGAAPMAYVLWTYFLRHAPHQPDWYNRDRFVLSAGHGSMLLYSLLHLTGYALPLSEIKEFRQWQSLTPGHPECWLTPGVEITTGPLGQGFANAVGMAMAEAYLAARYNRPGLAVIDHDTYVLASDGDMMEGVAAEAASLAGHLQLGKLICLYDSNHMTLSASTQLHYTEDTRKRFDAYGWHTQVIKDGNDLPAIYAAIKAAKKEKMRPSLLIIHTILGFASPNKQNTFKAHGSPLGKEEVALTKQALGWGEHPDFYIPGKARVHMRKAIAAGKQAEKEWKVLLKRYAKNQPDLYAELSLLMKNHLPKHWNDNLPSFPVSAEGMATRDAGDLVLQAIAPNLPGLIGGSADLNDSTKTALRQLGNFQAPAQARGDTQGAEKGVWSYAGRNIFYGVREHAMGAISNGLATVAGIIPYTATFLTFSDYMRPALRLAALMKRRVIFIFTHDSIGLGEDGPTHQPIEHLASLRAIPHLIVVRPADANETAAAFRFAVAERQHPVAIILTRQKVPTLAGTAKGKVDKGAYILQAAKHRKADLILIASGSEVQLIVAAQQQLATEGIDASVVSMPSWELFAAQSRAWQQRILPDDIKARLVVEAGIAQGWERYSGDKGDIICLSDFGASAKGEVLMKKFGLSVANICKRARALLAKS